MLGRRSISGVLAALLLAACGTSSPWKIQLKDGHEYLAKSKPEYQPKTGYYRYRNLQGKDALLRADEVLLVEQQ